MRLNVLAGALASLLIYSVSPTYASSPEEAAKYAVTVGNEATAILDKSVSDEEKRRQLTELFVEQVDTDWIGKFVLGRMWRTLSEDKQQTYLKYYRDFLISQYTSNFKEYAQGTKFEITQARPIGKRGNEYFVSTKINSDSGEPVKVEYRIRQHADTHFRVVDIVVEGVSLLATQRSEFSTVIQRKGIDYLIERLKARSATAETNRADNTQQ